MEENTPSKKEEYEAQKAKKKAKRMNRSETSIGLKKIVIIGVVVLIIGAGIFGIWRYSAKNSASPQNSEQSKIISRKGLHWHSELRIKILGKEQDVPANIGIGAIHQPLHTHEADNIIHMEFSRAVRENDIKLGQFFKIWGKKFNSKKVKMLINGKENNEFENYIMKDGDKIEISYE